ncbi:phage tail tube protein [Benzoatithermus flavus]|uniref:Phage tail tube protein n=1 Tax=Benzoatithermus flavus TaxID=3108223 RepID=A0ABU8XPN3_9PROT
MPRFQTQQVLLARVEAAYGQDPAPTASADALLVFDLQHRIQSTEIARRPVKPSEGSLASLYADQFVTLSFRTDLAGSGTPGTAPAWGKLLRGCKMAELITPGVKAQYRFVVGSPESLGFYYYLDGELHKVLGSRGTFTIEAPTNQIPSIRFDFTGLYAPPSAAAVPTPTLGTWKEPVPVNKNNTTCTLHGLASVVSAFQIQAGLSPKHRDLIGGRDVQYSGQRSTRGSITVEAPPVATRSWRDVADARTLDALQLTHGTTAGNIVEVSCSKVQPLQPQDSFQDGILYQQMALVICEGGVDELTITAR